jgi:cell division transport system permease protein
MIIEFFNTIFRIIKYSIQHLFRNFWRSLLVVMVLSLTFLFGELLAVMSIASNQVLNFFENQPQVTVFFKDTTTSEQITQIKDELTKDLLIEAVTYISKEQAVEIYKDRHKDEPELLEFVTPDILPASLQISVKQVSYLSDIANQFQDNQFVEKVVFQQDLVKEITNLTNAVRTAGLAMVGVLALISVIIILIVITDNIGAFSREIEIMRLVGAGSGYIRWPFILDGILFSLLATIIASMSLYWLLFHVEKFINGFIAPIGSIILPGDSTGIWATLDVISSLLPFTGNLELAAALGIVTFIIGACFTMVVSFISVSKHLRV